MGRCRDGASCWWIVVFISLSSLTKYRSVYSQTNSPVPGRPPVNIQPPSTVPQQWNAPLAARPRPIVVHCHPDSMEVVVQADMFDRGLHVDGRHLRLGSESASEGSACRAVSSGEAEFTIRAHLMDCGAELSSTHEKIAYSNVLVYSPEPSPDGVLRLDGAATPVVCHYEKRYSVEGISLRPTWDPYVSWASAEDRIDFNLQLMTDDWRFKRGSYSYFLGDPVHLELSAVIRKHTSLRVYVENCAAMATLDAQAPLRYNFIVQHGCFADAFLTNSSSHFLPRVEEHKLRFQLDAFRFYRESSNQVYMSCSVKAVPVMLPVCSQNRACSLIENRWQSIDGNDGACRSCDLSLRSEEPPSREPPTPLIPTGAWPSTPPPESLPHNGPQHPATYYRFRPGVHQNQPNNHQKPSAGLMRGGAGRTIQLGPITVLPSRKTDTRPADSETGPKNGTT